MGLEIVEITMEVEDHFSINVPPSWYEQMKTVDDMCRLIASHLDINGKPLCRAPRAFCKLRQGLMALGHSRSNVRTKTQLTEFIGDSGVQAFWRQLSEQTHFDLPELRRPPEVVPFLVTLPIVMLLGSLAAVFVAPLQDWPVLSLLVTLATLPVYVFGAIFLTRPFATFLPVGCVTVGDLVRVILQLNDVAPLAGTSHPEPSQILDRVRKIIADNVHIPIQDIHPHSRFIEDLSC